MEDPQPPGELPLGPRPFPGRPEPSREGVEHHGHEGEVLDREIQVHVAAIPLQLRGALAGGQGACPVTPEVLQVHAAALVEGEDAVDVPVGKREGAVGDLGVLRGDLEGERGRRDLARAQGPPTREFHGARRGEEVPHRPRLGPEHLAAFRDQPQSVQGAVPAADAPAVGDAEAAGGPGRALDLPGHVRGAVPAQVLAADRDEGKLHLLAPPQGHAAVREGQEQVAAKVAVDPAGGCEGPVGQGAFPVQPLSRQGERGAVDLQVGDHALADQAPGGTEADAQPRDVEAPVALGGEMQVLQEQAAPGGEVRAPQGEGPFPAAMELLQRGGAQPLRRGDMPVEGRGPQQGRRRDPPAPGPAPGRLAGAGHGRGASRKRTHAAPASTPSAGRAGAR